MITGPNMGGKSTYMRQAALIALLAHVGSYVPADEPRAAALLDRVSSRASAPADDLAGGRSTFMVEMTGNGQLILHNGHRAEPGAHGRGGVAAPAARTGRAWPGRQRISSVSASCHAICDSLFRIDCAGRGDSRLRQRAPGRHQPWRPADFHAHGEGRPTRLRGRRSPRSPACRARSSAAPVPTLPNWGNSHASSASPVPETRPAPRPRWLTAA